MNKRTVICYIGVGVFTIAITGLWLGPRASRFTDRPTDIRPGGSQEASLFPLDSAAPPGLLFEAIRYVEGDDGAIGPAGERGPYRITRAYWHDALEYLYWKIKFTDSFASLELIEQSYDYDIWITEPEVCEMIMKLYWQRYGADTDEKKARCHNGGPRGMQKQATVKYWFAVSDYIKTHKGE